MDPLATELQRWFEALSDASPHQVVQIGANDGKSDDPLFDLLQRQTRWRALLIEPVPSLFEQLRANYGDEDRFTFAQVAINDGTVAPFYYLSPAARRLLPDLPQWVEQLGSFKRENLTRYIPHLDRLIRELEVEGIRLPQLLERHGIEQVDILCIDAEGGDAQVVRQIELQQRPPAVIAYEHLQLSEHERQAAKAHLEGVYRCFDLAKDTVAVRLDLAQPRADHLEALWRERLDPEQHELPSMTQPPVPS